MKMYQPSRVLNEGSRIVGLEMTDLISLTIVYMITQAIFYQLDFEILTLPVMTIVPLILIQIRLTNRRGILKDYVAVGFIKVFRFGVYFDART